jgi:hypothetical protein
VQKVGENEDPGGRRSGLKEEVEAIAEPGGAGANPFGVDGGNAVGVEAGGVEPKSAVAIRENGALEDGGETAVNVR